MSQIRLIAQDFVRKSCKVISNENIQSFYTPSSAIPNGLLCKLYDELGLYIIGDNGYSEKRKILDIEVDEYVSCSDGYIYYNTNKNDGLYRFSIKHKNIELIIDSPCHELYSYGEGVYFTDIDRNNMYEYQLGRLTKLSDNYCSDIFFPFYLNWNDDGRLYMIAYEDNAINQKKIIDDSVFDYYAFRGRYETLVYYSSMADDGKLKIFTSTTNQNVTIDFRPSEICYADDIYFTSKDELGIFVLKENKISKVVDTNASHLRRGVDGLYYIERAI